MTDKLPECRDAFDKIFVKHFPTKSVHRFACKEIWQASRSAFAAELVRRLQEMNGKLYDRKWIERKEAIAIIRQLSQQKGE